ncbi:MAG: type II secretion system protein [Sulfurimonas sp.]|nr:type II secretion system protein [Sulfurimonas sp.]
MKFSRGFTMIELVFVIVVLGILASIAVPRFAATRTDAEITKGRADIASIRSAIVTERQAQLIVGVNTWIPTLSINTTTLFTGNGAGRTLLMYGITAGIGSGHWQSTSGTAYTYTVGTVAVPFTYTSATGIFTCSTTAAGTGEMCKTLTD